MTPRPIERPRNLTNGQEVVGGKFTRSRHSGSSHGWQPTRNAVPSFHPGILLYDALQTMTYHDKPPTISPTMWQAGREAPAVTGYQFPECHTRCLLWVQDGRWSGPLRRALTTRSVTMTTCETLEELRDELHKSPDAAVVVELTAEQWIQRSHARVALQDQHREAIWVGLLTRPLSWQAIILWQQGWTYLHHDRRALHCAARLIRMHAERCDARRANARASAASLQELQFKIDSQLPWRDSP